jgi:katanin p60 ATPase-containing subunit A1
VYSNLFVFLFSKVFFLSLVPLKIVCVLDMPPTQPYTNRAEPARGSSLHTIKTQQRAREEEEKIRQRRKKGVIVMMLQFLQDQGYGRTLEALQLESQLSLQKVAAADNMDIVTIFSEYEDYQEFRFGRVPRFFRNLDGSDAVHVDSASSAGGEGERKRPPPVATNSGVATPPDGPNNAGRPGKNSGQTPTVATPSSAGGQSSFTAAGHGAATTSHSGNGPSSTDLGNAGLTGTSIKHRPVDAPHAPPVDPFVGRQLKPMPRFASSELTELAMTIQRDILDANPNVSWNDIAELDDAKNLLREAVVMPVKYPQLFQGIVRPWKGTLLFGPPGTGKTMLAKALATECRSTFFNISASSIVSKWRGDSEKLVRMLFELAAHYAPSTIFIDELDSLMSSRASDGSEHEGSRRMKTELLVQMDGLQHRPNGEVVFVLAASNVPWDLDAAMLRRLEKRVLVGLPSLSARRQLLARLLHDHVDEKSFDFDLVAAKTEGLSGADIDILCREAMMRPIRALIHKLEHEKVLSTTPLTRPKVQTDDAIASVACTKSSGSSVPLAKYTQWEAQFGSGMSS